MKKQRYTPKHLATKPGSASGSERTADTVSVSETESTNDTRHATKPVRSSEPRTPGRRKYGFFAFLLVFALLVLCGICAGAFYLWDYLESFEASRPEHIIEQMSENIDYDFWRESVENALIPRLTHFEADVSSALEPHLPYITDVRYTIRQRPEDSKDDLLVYTVRAGASDIGIVRLSPTEEAGHGFYIWGVESLELLESFLDSFSRSITITASQNARVEVNGIAVSGEYLIECGYEHGSTYQIHDLYGDAEVTVIEFDGQKPDAVYAQYDEYYFPITIPFSVSYNIVVPFGALVYADGERVSAENITDSQIIPTIFRGAADQAQNPYIASSRYEFGFSNVYIEPLITVTDAQGAVLGAFEADDGVLVYREDYSESLKAIHAATAENFIREYVRFSSNVGGNPGSNLAALSTYMQRNSALYRHLQNAVSTRTWTRVSQQVIFHELEADNFRQYGDNYFTCEVYCNLTQRGHVETVDLEMRHEILFVNSDGRWLVANIIAID